MGLEEIHGRVWCDCDERPVRYGPAGLFRDPRTTTSGLRVMGPVQPRGSVSRHTKGFAHEEICEYEVIRLMKRRHSRFRCKHERTSVTTSLFRGAVDLWLNKLRQVGMYLDYLAWVGIFNGRCSSEATVVVQ